MINQIKNFHYEKGNDERGFTLVEAVITVAIVMILSVSVGTLVYNGSQDNSKQKAVETATQVGYSAALANLADFDESTTIDSAFAEVGDERVTLSYTGVNKHSLCVTGEWTGEEGKFIRQVGECNSDYDTSGNEPKPTPTPASNLLSSFKFVCDSTRTKTLPFNGLSTDASVYVEGSDGSANLVEVTKNTSTTVPVTMAAGVSYTVSIDGNFTGFKNADSLMGCLTEVTTLGEDLEIEHLSFQNAFNLVNVPDSIPSSVTSLRSAFYHLRQFNDPDVGSWDVSNVTDMTNMFSYSTFNGDISGWDVSNVTKMADMFYASSSFNGDISDWDVSSVKDMRSMFNGSSFNGDISGWDVSSVTVMKNMFFAASFNGDISGWDVSNVTDMSHMFYQANAFMQDLSGWNISSSTDITNMFNPSYPLEYQPKK